MAAKILLAALLAVPAIAKTDLSGCTSYDSILFQGNSPYVSKIYYVPDTGEVCEFLDCGGGRAPPKTTVPGCDSYEGTETYSPRFINPKTLGEVASETDAAGSETEDSTATITEAPSSTKAGSKTTGESEEETTTEDEETTTAEEASTAEDTTAEETTAVEQTTTTKDTSSTITTITTQGTPAAGSGAASSGSESESEAAATPASTVSTGGAVMPTAGAFLGSCLMAGAMYAGLL